MSGFRRREFLGWCGLAGASMLGRGVARASFPDYVSVGKTPSPLSRTYRAAAIGSTGRGDFGHGLDRVFVELPGVEFVAIADDDPAGLETAGRRNGVERLYADYRQMLERENLDLVSVGTRHSELHEPLVIDCAQAGKHVFCEKPLAHNLASADRMLAACRAAKVKLAVALPNHASPAVQAALELMRSGRLGAVLALRGRGKEDHRSGGEDLTVLGYHVLDLMCLFAGHPQWTFAHVRHQGRDATADDARTATEPIGPVLGDDVAAMYGFGDGAVGYFDSRRSLEGGVDRFSLEIQCSQGVVAMRSLADVVWFEGPIFNPAKPHEWRPISTPEWDSVANKGDWCNQQLVLDLLRAVEEDRAPLASGDDALWAQEMIQSVYTSHLAKERVELPLERREHPLQL